MNHVTFKLHWVFFGYYGHYIYVNVRIMWQQSNTVSISRQQQ